MRKPRNEWELFGELSLILGVLFLCVGVLSRAGVLKTDPGSHGDPGVVFPAAGCAFLIMGTFSVIVAFRKISRSTKLLETGMPVTGKISAVKQRLFTQWGHSHPYVVYFSYELDGVQYKGKSGLFWAPPSVREGESETIFIDADHPRHCMLKLKE